ncbi:mannosyltransferase [Tilletia horrida]|uniref:Mannosyltransferase n=1 Tax=Tilletia horrida TaxID=155126 RepID=A0AAN6GNT1_9BASI|nr:mannosyltransferase [Tilletia horrida]KAK0562335.1 mannosyltransferase [Tilletia horrida]
MAHISAGSRFSDLPPELQRASAASKAPRPPTNHLLQDHHQQAPPQQGSQSLLSKTASWAPSFLLAFRFLTITRLIAARYVIFPDCDETFNYWESLHLLIYPPITSVIPGLLPFQTWEYAPQFAIRSYTYLLPYLGVAKVGRTFMPLMSKLDTLFLIRNFLALLSSAVEAKFCTAVVDTIHPRVGKYLFFLLLTNAGMSAASTALLPSTFTMYTTTLALAYAFYPSRLPSPNSVSAPSNLSVTDTPAGRTLIATATFALGALLGWPFAIVLSFPFVVEEVFLPSGNSVPASFAKGVSFVQARFVRFVGYALLSGLFIGGATVLVDSLAYGKINFVPLGIVIYNVLSSRRGAGPELYGVEPPTYYLANLALSFNILLPLALLSAPLAFVTAFLVDPTRFDPPARTFPLTSSASDAKDKKSGLLSSSRFALLAFRLAPFYLWLALLTSQPHKEERFMFPAYPLLCFNAAVSIYFVRVLAETVLRLLFDSSNKASNKAPLHVTLPSALTVTLLVLTSVLSLLRSFHSHASFYAPTAVLEHFSHREMPRVVARLFPTTLTSTAQKRRLAAGLDAFPNDAEERANHPGIGGTLPSWLSLTDEPPALPSLAGLVDMGLLQSHFKGASQSPRPIRLCYGKEWHRFPSHFYVPHGVQVDFVKSEFNGILPKHYTQQPRAAGNAPTDRVVSLLDGAVGWLWPWKDVTRTRQDGFNDMNREEVDRYVDIDTCDYLVDLDHPHRYASGASSVSALEPRHAVDSAKWTRVYCLPFLDTDASREASSSKNEALSGPMRIASKVLSILDRTLFIPGPIRRAATKVLGWQSSKKYGDYCLLRTTRKESWANAKGPVAQ